MISNCNLNWVDIRNHLIFFTTHDPLKNLLSIIHYLIEMVFYIRVKVQDNFHSSDKSGAAQWFRTVG